MNTILANAPLVKRSLILCMDCIGISHATTKVILRFDILSMETTFSKLYPCVTIDGQIPMLLFSLDVLHVKFLSGD